VKILFRAMLQDRLKMQDLGQAADGKDHSSIAGSNTLSRLESNHTNTLGIHSKGAADFVTKLFFAIMKDAYFSGVTGGDGLCWTTGYAWIGIFLRRCIRNGLGPRVSGSGR